MNATTSLAGVLFKLAVEKAVVELGERHFDETIKLAENSRVPASFLQATLVSGPADMERIARHIFGDLFHNVDEYVYALVYAHAISSVKTWMEIDQQIAFKLERVSELTTTMEKWNRWFNRLARVLGCQPQEVPDRLEALNIRTEVTLPTPDIEDMRMVLETMNQILDGSMVKELEALRASNTATAQKQCGVLYQTEKMIGPPKVRYFWAWIQWWSLRLSGQKMVASELPSIRQKVEQFFAVPQNIAKIILLASGSR